MQHQQNAVFTEGLVLAHIETYNVCARGQSVHNVPLFQVSKLRSGRRQHGQELQEPHWYHRSQPRGWPAVLKGKGGPLHRL